MYDDNSISRFLGPIAISRLSVSTAVAVALLANFPLALLFGLNAQVRDLGRPGGGPAQVFVGTVSKTEAPRRSVAVVIEPKAVLETRTVEVPRSDVPALAVAGNDFSRNNVRPATANASPRDGGCHTHPSMRAYNPLAPPFIAA